MIETTPLAAREAIVTNLDSVISQRIESATLVAVLSQKDDRRLRLIQEANGSRFVIREYTADGVKYIERSGRPFAETWKDTQQMYQAAGINTVRSALLESHDSIDTPISIVSEFIGDLRPVIEAPAELKRDLAEKMGNLLSSSSEFLPHPEILFADLFHFVPGEEDNGTIVLTDLDPIVTDKERVWSDDSRRDNYYALYIREAANLIWNSWCKEEERSDVIGHFYNAIGRSRDAIPTFGIETSRAFGIELFNMKNDEYFGVYRQPEMIPDELEEWPESATAYLQQIDDELREVKGNSLFHIHLPPPEDLEDSDLERLAKALKREGYNAGIVPRLHPETGEQILAILITCKIGNS